MRAQLLAGIATTLATVASLAAPILEGPWEYSGKSMTLRTADGKVPPLTAEGKKMQLANLSNPQGDPIKRCLPPGIPRALMQKGFVFDLPIGKDLAGMFFEWNHLPRPIYLDIDHFENIGPTYLGQSVAKWEGDTLVVHTNGFNETTWLDEGGLPHSEELETVERIRLKNASTLENRITFTDPKVFSKPWTAVLTFTKRSGRVVKDDYCLARMGLVKQGSESTGSKQ